MASDAWYVGRCMERLAHNLFEFGADGAEQVPVATNTAPNYLPHLFHLNLDVFSNGSLRPVPGTRLQVAETRLEALSHPKRSSIVIGWCLL